MASHLHPDIARLAGLGWRLAPTMRRSRAGRFKGFIDLATSDLDTLALWQSQDPGGNWVVVPEGSAVFALDIDVAGSNHAHDGVVAMRDLVRRHGPLPPHPHGRSGGGGHLLIFTATVPVQVGSGKPEPGIDCLANRCSFTVSPSLHHRTGQPYYWVTPPWVVAPPPAPAWLLALLAPPPPPARPNSCFAPTEDRALRALHRSVDAIANAAPGQRNAALLRHATLAGGYIAGGLLGADAAMRALTVAARAVGQTEAQARSTIASGFRRGAARPLGGDAR